MSRRQRKLEESQIVKTGNKILKKTRTGGWVAVAMLGMLVVGSSPVNVGATEQSEEEIVETEQVAEESQSDRHQDSLLWVANTSEQIASEMERQSTEKEQDPLQDYTITWGDTLSVIAQVTGSTVEELAELNNIENVDLIYAGDDMVLADGTVIRVGEEVTQEQESETTTTEQATGSEQVSTPTQTEPVVSSSNVGDNTEEEQDTGNFTPVENEGNTTPGPVVETPKAPEDTSVTEPEVTEPEVTEPEVTEPEVTEPRKLRE